jgi:hypothetical protein
LEGFLVEKKMKELVKKEAQAKQQVEAARVKLKAFEATFSRPE